MFTKPYYTYRKKKNLVTTPIGKKTTLHYYYTYRKNALTIIRPIGKKPLLHL